MPRQRGGQTLDFFFYAVDFQFDFSKSAILSCFENKRHLLDKFAHSRRRFIADKKAIMLPLEIARPEPGFPVRLEISKHNN